MNKFNEYKEQTVELLEMIEKLDTKYTKAESKRIRKQMDTISKLKVEAKKDLIAEDSK
jgi:predicted KAP-like P-loop ATPase